MSIKNQDHTMSAGESKVFTCTSDYRSTSGLVDFTAATIVWTLKDKAGTTIKTLTASAGITVTASGVFTMTLAAADTVGLSGEYRHECTTVLAAGTDAVLFSGVIYIEPRLA